MDLKMQILPTFSAVVSDLSLNICKSGQNDGLFGATEVKYAKIWIFQYWTQKSENKSYSKKLVIETQYLV